MNAMSRRMMPNPLLPHGGRSSKVMGLRHGASDAFAFFAGATPYKAGTSVEIQGLRNDVRMNGQIAQVIEKTADGNYRVKANGNVYKLQPQNLKAARTKKRVVPTVVQPEPAKKRVAPTPTPFGAAERGPAKGKTERPAETKEAEAEAEEFESEGKAEEEDAIINADKVTEEQMQEMEEEAMLRKAAGRSRRVEMVQEMEAKLSGETMEDEETIMEEDNRLEFMAAMEDDRQCLRDLLDDHPTMQEAKDALDIKRVIIDGEKPIDTQEELNTLFDKMDKADEAVVKKIKELQKLAGEGTSKIKAGKVIRKRVEMTVRELAKKLKICPYDLAAMNDYTSVDSTVGSDAMLHVPEDFGEEEEEEEEVESSSDDEEPLINRVMMPPQGGVGNPIIFD